jgi:hypothetical protein
VTSWLCSVRLKSSRPPGRQVHRTPRRTDIWRRSKHKTWGSQGYGPGLEPISWTVLLIIVINVQLGRDNPLEVSQANITRLAHTGTQLFQLGNLNEPEWRGEVDQPVLLISRFQWSTVQTSLILTPTFVRGSLPGLNWGSRCGIAHQRFFL